MQQQSEIEANDALSSIWRQRWKVAGVAFGGAVLGIVYNFVIPPVYQATTVLLLPPPTASASASAFITATGAANPLDILKGMAVSKASIDYVAQGSKVPPREIIENITTVVDPASNQLVLSSSNGKKQTALKMTELRLAGLEKVQSDATKSMARLQAQELANAVTQKERELKNAEEELLKFQKNTKTAPDPTTPFTGSAYLKQLKDVEFNLGRVNEQLNVARAAVKNRVENPDVPASGSPAASVTDKWRDRLIQLDNDLRVAKTKFGDISPEVQTLERAIAVTRETFRQELLKYMQSVEKNVDSTVAELEANRLILEWQKQYLIEMNNFAPTEAVQFQRLLREVNIRAETLRQVRQQLEQERIGAEVERVRWSVLVPPFLDGQPVNKRPTRYAALGGILGIMVGAFWFARAPRRRGKIDLAPPA